MEGRIRPEGLVFATCVPRVCHMELSRNFVFLYFSHPTPNLGNHLYHHNLLQLFVNLRMSLILEWFCSSVGPSCVFFMPQYSEDIQQKVFPSKSFPYELKKILIIDKTHTHTHTHTMSNITFFLNRKTAKEKTTKTWARPP